MSTAKKVVAVVKKVVAKKVAPKVEGVAVEETTTDFCTNCENSGMECNVCGGGKSVV